MGENISKEIPEPDLSMSKIWSKKVQTPPPTPFNQPYEFNTTLRPMLILERHSFSLWLLTKIFINIRSPKKGIFLIIWKLFFEEPPEPSKKKNAGLSSTYRRHNFVLSKKESMTNYGGFSTDGRFDFFNSRVVIKC